MKAGLLPKSGTDSLQQVKFPVFGFLFLALSVLIQFVWGGMKAAKILLMVDELQFSETEALIIIHLQYSLMDLFSCIGSIIANLKCGPYISCIVQEVLKALFTCPLCLLATMGLMELDKRRNFYLYGQAVGVLTSFANGCMTSFLADQFNVINYIKFNRVQLVITLICSALGIFTVPHIIQYYQCFWTKTCYSFVWMSEWALCIIQVFVLIVMCRKLVINHPKFSASYMMMTLASDAAKKRRKAKGTGRVSDKHLFDYSDLYSSQIRKDAQKMWSMWTFYFPLAGYWALHSQQSTTWILQAKRLNGNLFNWSTVLPNELWGVVPLTGVAIRMILLTFVGEVKYPLRITIFSQLIMAVAFMLAAVLEKFIIDKGDHEVHMVWALPQLLLVSISDITLLVSYRIFILREVPAGFRGVTQNLFVLSRCFGNAIVVLVNFMEWQTGFPKRMGQFIFYATILNLFLIMFTVINRKFERLFRHEGQSEAGPSGAKR